MDLGLDYEIESGNKSKDFLFTQNERVSLNLTFNGEQLGSLTIDEPYASIEEKLGKAAEVDGNMTYKYGQIGSSQTDMHYGIMVYVNRNSQTVSGFEIGKSIQESDRKNLSMLSFENVPNAQTSDIHNVTLLWAPEYKQIPGMLTSQRCADSVLNDNG